MNVQTITITPEAIKGFYPTPPELADKLLSGINWDYIETVLEPSAGKGDLIKAATQKARLCRYHKELKHTWYPEMEKNIHYYNGWKTNKAHKIGGKVILPIYGVFADRYWSRETFSVYEAEKIISDIEKVFDYLDGSMTASVNLHGILQTACNEGQTRNIPCKFFDVTLYKKGTMHIKFRNQELVDRFNIYCCKHKGWLPPSYGKARYSNMQAGEKAVVDSFHGDGKEGSGEKGYNVVMARADYFLSEPVNEMPLLMSGA